MSKHGTYSVKNVAKDKSFTNFICWLTIFLVLLLVVYLVLTYCIGDLNQNQNLVDKNASNAEITYLSHKTTNFLEKDNGGITNGPNEVTRSSVPSGGYTDTKEEFLDDKYSRESSSSSTWSEDSAKYMEFNQSQSRPEVESTTSFETDNATVKYSNHYREKYTRDIFSARKSTTATYSTIVTKLMKWNQPPKTTPSTSFTRTTISYQEISTEKQTSLIEKHFKEPSPTATQSTSVAGVTGWNQTPKGAPNTFFAPTTTPHQDISTEKQKFLDDRNSQEPSPVETQSPSVTGVTKWNEITKNATITFSTPTTRSYQGISAQKLNFLDDRYSTEPSPAATQSTLVKDVREWNQTSKDIPNVFLVPTTLQQYRKYNIKKPNVLDGMMFSKEPSFAATKTTLVLGAVNTFSTPTTRQHQYINKGKQPYLDEMYSKAQSFTATESTDITKLNPPQTSPSNTFVTPKITRDPQDFYTQKLNIVDEMSSTQTSSNVSGSKTFMQSEVSNKLQDMSTTKSTTFHYLIPQNQSASELMETSRTRGSSKATEPGTVHKHINFSVAATTKDTVSLINQQNITTLPYSETFSSIVELLSVTGSLLPISGGFNHFDEAVTQNGTTLADRDHLSTFKYNVSHTTLVGEHVAEQFDPESINKLDGAVCDGHICRKAAAKTLYQIDFDADICRYPYTYFCGGGKIEKWDFLDTILKDLISFIKRIDEKSSKYFQVFANTFYMCNKFSSFSVLEQVDRDVAKLPKEYKDFVGELLLTQSIPLFDIDVSPIGNLFQIQISPPGLNIWKSSTSRWSVLNHVKSSCLDEATQSLNATVDMQLISQDIKTCCKKKLLSYIQKYAGNSFNNGTHIIHPKIVEQYRRWIKEYFFETYEDPEWNYVNITMKDFCDGKDYHLGVEWRDLFSTLGMPYDATNIIRIYYPERVKKVISQAMNKKWEIIDILKAWYRIQAYSNMIQLINKNNARYCLELVSELMPDVAPVMVQEAVDESMYNDSLSTVKTLFDGLKQTFIKSLPKMVTKKDALKVFEDKLNEVRLMPSMRLTIDNIYNVKMENTFYGSVMALLKHRRKSVFELLKRKVKVDFLLKYFVSPFDTRLHTFHPYKTIVFQPGFLYRAFETEFLPRQIYLSKIGFILAEELIKFYMHLERGQSEINKMNETISGYGYLIDGEEYSFSSWILPANQIKNDKMTLELIVRHLFEDSREIEKLSWLNGTFSNSQAFIITTMQEFCDWSTAADVTKELYNNRLPAAFRIKSLMLSSKFALESFSCQ